MLRYAILFFVIALVAAVFGFGIAGDAAWIAQVLVVVFLILSVASMLMSSKRLRV